MTSSGHNNGPSLGRRTSWRKYCWTKARADLMPHLPIEILRNRVKRAKELGLEYKTYASVRASTGHDVIGFLFSSNALRAFKHHPKLPPDRSVKLAALKDCKRIALVVSPLTPDAFLAANPSTLLGAVRAPEAHAGWSATRNAIHASLAPDKLPADGILLIGDTTLEREWSTAGRLAGYLPADRYFNQSV
ncbi:MAG: hypothetical protein V3V25_03585 [Paracoccaceae bacterium]